MDSTGSIILPSSSSTIAGEVDALFYFIMYIGIFFFTLIVGITIFFVMKYRRRKKAELTPDIAENKLLEIVWTVIPSILVTIIFFWGFNTFLKMQVAPKDAIEIKVTGQRWFWSFDYPNGANSQNELVVPVNNPVKLLISSSDVIHSFFVPDFRVKMDAVPNLYTTAWFEATRQGEFNLFCAEYCGQQHSLMKGVVRVVTEKEYQEWTEANMNLGEGLSLEEFGAVLYKSKLCHTCHSLDGTANKGPTFKGLFGSIERLQDGSDITVDENYVRESILNPRAKIVMGFEPVMSTYQGLLRDREIDALVAYIKSLGAE